MDFNDWITKFKSGETNKEEKKPEIVVSVEKETVPEKETTETKEDLVKVMEEFKKGLIDLVKGLEEKLEKIHD